MATDGERNRALRRERNLRRRRMTEIQRDTAAELTALLELALERIRLRLAAGPSAFETFILPELQSTVRRSLDEVQAGLAIGRAAGESWQAGVDLVEKPIEAGFRLEQPGFRLAAFLPEVDLRQLTALRSALTDRIKDVTATLAGRVNSELGLAAIGVQTTGEAADKIADILARGGRGRALTIVRTELGRAYSVAGQQRYDQAREVLPGLQKQWRRSGKIHSRASHDRTDGQVRDVEESFDVGGVALRFPRDPSGPAKETVNCGCTSLPFMATWEVTTPGRQPFTPTEIAARPSRATLEPVP